MSTKKIAIIGAGIFGVSAAWILAKYGHKVDLFEKNSDILQAASSINQYRIHKGYHYPRSQETVSSAKMAYQEFIDTYGLEIVSKNVDHYYCIAKKDSLVSASEYLQVLDKNNLTYKKVSLDILQSENIDLTIKVSEELFDPNILKNVCLTKINEFGVNLHLNCEVKYQELDGYDFVIIATYSQNNLFLQKFPGFQRDYQYELCEKIVVELPSEFTKKGVVIMDGPFTCVDPLGNSNQFVIGNVVHAIHQRTIGKLPEIPASFTQLLNKGIIANPPITNFTKFIESASFYFKNLNQAKHIGSMYTYRTVLPKREHDDARPTLVEQIDNRTITIFSGKIPTCIQAAKEVLKIIKDSNF